MEENISQTLTPVIAESTPAPPVSKPPFGSWWKVGGLVLGAVILAGGLFFAGYQYSQKQTPPIAQPTPTPVVVVTPTPDPTANWKTYTNNAFKYSFKYPPDWRFPQEEVYGTLPESNHILVSSPDNIGTGQYPDKVNPDALIVSVYILDKTPELDKYWQSGLRNPKQTTVSGITAQTGISYQGTGSDFDPEDPSIHSWATIIDHDSKIYNISAGPLNSKKLDIYYQILSTFQFLD